MKMTGRNLWPCNKRFHRFNCPISGFDDPPWLTPFTSCFELLRAERDCPSSVGMVMGGVVEYHENRTIIAKQSKQNTIFLRHLVIFVTSQQDTFSYHRFHLYPPPFLFQSVHPPPVSFTLLFQEPTIAGRTERRTFVISYCRPAAQGSESLLPGWFVYYVWSRSSLVKCLEIWQLHTKRKLFEPRIV